MAIVRRAASVDRASQRAVEWLVHEGVFYGQRPDFDVPVIPVDIADLPDGDLMELFAQLTQWLNYLLIKVGIAAIDEKEAEQAVRYDAARSTVANWEGGASSKVTIAEARRDMDETVIARKQSHLDAYARRKTLETVSGNVERSLALVSRELTRRVGGQSTGLNKRRATWG